MGRYEQRATSNAAIMHWRMHWREQTKENDAVSIAATVGSSRQGDFNTSNSSISGTNSRTDLPVALPPSPKRFSALSEGFELPAVFNLGAEAYVSSTDAAEITYTDKTPMGSALTNPSTPSEVRIGGRRKLKNDVTSPSKDTKFDLPRDPVQPRMAIVRNRIDLKRGRSTLPESLVKDSPNGRTGRSTKRLKSQLPEQGIPHTPRSLLEYVSNSLDADDPMSSLLDSGQRTIDMKKNLSPREHSQSSKRADCSLSPPDLIRQSDGGSSDNMIESPITPFDVIVRANSPRHVDEASIHSDYSSESVESCSIDSDFSSSDTEGNLFKNEVPIPNLLASAKISLVECLMLYATVARNFTSTTRANSQGKESSKEEKPNPGSLGTLDQHGSSSSLKRKVDCMDNRDREEEENEQRDNLNPNMPSDLGARKMLDRLLACPYFKRDAIKGRKSRSCPGPGWKDVHRLKYVTLANPNILN
jgi:hypothetical protein